MPLRKNKRLNSIKSLKVMVTAGPTREYWDPIRFLTNASSGTMGIALAQEASHLGASVTLILGPVPSSPRPAPGLKVVRVTTADEMNAAVQDHLLDTQVFIGAAAVSDYRPAEKMRSKIKDREPTVTMRLVRNPDIIAKVAERTPQRPPIVIGFALETQDLMKNALDKLQRKGLDWVVANRESTIGSKSGEATLLSRWGERIPLGKMPKPKLAKRIWEALLSRPAL